MSPTGETRVELGQVVGAHGIRGQVRVRYFGDGPDHLLNCSEVWLAPDLKDSQPRRFEVLFGGTGRAGEARLALAGIDDRDAAKALRGLLVVVDESQLDHLAEDEFYWHQLIGCAVECIDGRPIGIVAEIWETGAHDVLVVRDEKGNQNLIPTARELTPRIDLAERKIVVQEIPGLFELAEDPGGSREGKEGTGD